MLGNEWEILVAAFECYKLLSLCKLCQNKLAGKLLFPLDSSSCFEYDMDMGN